MTKHQTLQVGMVYTVDSIMIAAGITLALVIFLTIFAFQVLLFISSVKFLSQVFNLIFRPK